MNISHIITSKNCYKLVFIIALLSCSYSYAGSLQSGYIAKVAMEAPKWAMMLQPKAVKIFMLLWWFETMLQALFQHMFQLGRIKELLRFVITRSIFMGFFSALLISPTFYLAIPEFFAKIAGGNIGSGILGIDPSDVWQNYANWFTNDYSKVLNGLGISQIGTQLSLAIGCIIYLLTTIFISSLIIMLNIEVYVMIYGSLILTSCAGSNWTRNWWNSYLGACVSIGLKIMLFLLLYGVLKTNMQYHVSDGQSIDVWTQIVNCIICTLVLTTVPSKIAGIVSSAGAGNFGGELVAGFMGGIAVGTKTMGAVHNAAGGVISVGGKTANLTKQIGGAFTNSSTQPQASMQDKAKFLNKK